MNRTLTTTAIAIAIAFTAPAHAIPQAFCAAPKICICYSDCFAGFGPTEALDSLIKKSILNETFTLTEGNQAIEECKTVRTTSYLDAQRVVFCDHLCNRGWC
jgi:hypothetical protein